MSLKLGTKATLVIGLFIVALAIMANRPLLAPDRAPSVVVAIAPAAATSSPGSAREQKETIVGTWASESPNAYTLMEYRGDGSLKAYIQPKTLYGATLVGKRRLTGRWEQPGGAHVIIISFGTEGGTRGTRHEIRFEGVNNFTDTLTGQRWIRVERSL